MVSGRRYRIIPITSPPIILCVLMSIIWAYNREFQTDRGGLLSLVGGGGWVFKE